VGLGLHDGLNIPSSRQEEAEVMVEVDTERKLRADGRKYLL
jgi:hypothetical protein